ncbi:hypothetical protein N9E12_02140 [Candidatus Marinimicrobia bacterium]|nr:hypothetical protein [Candidatus Neomarinimicrobiota bacterium]
MRKGDCSEYGGPKYRSQKKVFDKVKVVFKKAIINRELLLDTQVKHEHKDKIIILDLRISICIKKRARLTLGGYSYLPEEMYDWEPIYEIDRSLLPKTVT